MAFGGRASIGTGTTSAAATSTSLTTTATANVGDIIVIRLAKNNAATADGVTNEFTGVTDSAGNTYTKRGEYTHSHGASGDGATVALFDCVVTTQLSSGGTITANHDSNTDVCIAANKYTKGAGTTLAQAGTTQVIASDTIPGSLSLSGLTSREYLFIAASAEEEETGSATTVSSGYTASDVVVSTTAGSATSNMTLRGEDRILTGTGSTSNMGGDSADHATIFVALYEVAASGGKRRRRIFCAGKV